MEAALSTVGEHLSGKPRRHLLDFLMHILQGIQRIHPVAHHHNATDRFRATLIERSASRGRTIRHVGDVSDEHRDRVTSLDDGVLDVLGALDETKPPDDVFDLVDFDGTGADVDISPPERTHDVLEGDTVSPHQGGIDIHLKLAHKATHRSHLTDPLHRQEAIAHVPVLNRPQLVEIPTAGGISGGIPSFKEVPHHLPDASRIRTQFGLHPRGQKTGGQAAELLQHAGA